MRSIIFEQFTNVERLERDMDLSSDLLHQLTHDRAHALRAPAANRRAVGYVPARRRVAQSLRRAADRLDAAAVPSVPGGERRPRTRLVRVRG
jgi:peptidoglycan/xylan/chitin deacetylase (PgdA/CDA1 family)